METRKTTQIWVLLAAFYALACAISWLAITQVRPSGGIAVWQGQAFELLAKFGPSLAGLVMAPFAWPMLRTFFAGAPRKDWRAGLLFLIGVGLIFPGLVTLIAACGGAFAGAGFHVPGTSTEQFEQAVYWLSRRTFLGGGFGEEIGFRGVALPLLLMLMGPRKAAGLLGVAWGLWHLPVLIGHPAQIWIAQLLMTVSLSFIFTYFYLLAGRRLSVMILLHGAINGWINFFEKSLMPQLDDDIVFQVTRLLIFVLIAVALALKWPKGGPASASELKLS